MKRLRWPLAFLVAGSLAAVGSVGAQAPLAPAQQIGARDSKQTISPEAALSEARRLSMQGKFDEAIRQLEVLARNQPDLKGVAHELGVAYYKKGDYLKAVESFKKALEENPGDNEAVQLMGISYYLAGRPREAIAPLEKVQTWYPSANVDAAYILGICYIQTKDYPSARKAFAKMFGVSAESAASYLFTARMLLRQDFEPVAEEYAKKALELNPGDAAVYYKLADAYTRSQKYDEAEKLLQRSIWLDATSTGPYILMGKVLEKKGETALAVRALQRALAMDPNNPIPHHLLGQAYRELGRTEEAERELKLSEQLQAQQNAKP